MPYKLTDLAKKFSPWSTSKADIAETCPRQFKYKYLVKTERGEAASANTVGTAVHAVLEHCVKGRTHEDAQKDALASTPLTANEVETFRSLQTNLLWFLRKWNSLCIEYRVQTVLTEHAWGITVDMRPTDFFADDVFFRGKMDLGGITQDKKLIVIDHKTGIAKNVKKSQRILQQLLSYGVLALANETQLSGVLSGVHFLQGTESKRFQLLDIVSPDTIRNNHIPSLFNRLNVCSQYLTDPFITRPNYPWPCEYCPFQNHCNGSSEVIDAT